MTISLQSWNWYFTGNPYDFAILNQVFNKLLFYAYNQIQMIIENLHIGNKGLVCLQKSQRVPIAPYCVILMNMSLQCTEFTNEAANKRRTGPVSGRQKGCFAATKRRILAGIKKK